MTRHFTEISSVYRPVRTTDREPVKLIAREFEDLARPRGADIGCGDRRETPLDRLVKQAGNRHYSTFSLYEPDEFEDALVAFRAAVKGRFADTVQWYDENILVRAVRDDG